MTYQSTGSGTVTELTVDFSATSGIVGQPFTFYIKAKNNAGSISPSVSVTLAGFTPGPITNNANFLAAIDGYLGTPVQKEAVLKAYYNIEIGTSCLVWTSTFNQDISGWPVSNLKMGAPGPQGSVL